MVDELVHVRLPQASQAVTFASPTGVPVDDPTTSPVPTPYSNTKTTPTGRTCPGLRTIGSAVVL